MPWVEIQVSQGHTPSEASGTVCPPLSAPGVSQGSRCPWAVATNPQSLPLSSHGLRLPCVPHLLPASSCGMKGHGVPQAGQHHGHMSRSLIYTHQQTPFLQIQSHLWVLGRAFISGAASPWTTGPDCGLRPPHGLCSVLRHEEYEPWPFSACHVALGVSVP